MPARFLHLFWLILGVLISFLAHRMDLGTPSLPGPGFFPFLTGIVMAVAAGIVLVQDWTRDAKQTAARGISPGLRNVLVVFASLVGYGVLLESLGFVLCTFILVAILLRVIGSRNWITMALGAGLAAAGSYAMFQRLLDAQLPKGILSSSRLRTPGTPPMLESILTGFNVAVQPMNLLFCFVGVLTGTLVGVLPGIGPSAAIALLLPITFHAPPAAVIIMLAGIYYGAMYGGSTTSILVNVPGEAASIVTCLDG